MFRFIASRFLQSVLALYFVISATFFMVRFVPGGPFTGEKAVTPEIMRNLEATKESRDVVNAKLTGLMPTMADLKVSFPAILRGTALGSILGISAAGSLLSAFGPPPDQFADDLLFADAAATTWLLMAIVVILAGITASLALRPSQQVASS